MVCVEADILGLCEPVAFGLSDKNTTRGLSEVTYSKLGWLMIPLKLLKID